MRISDKVWVVTGGGSGMGRELVLQLLERGALVAAVDRNPDGLAEVAARTAVGHRLSTHVVDITDRAAVRGLPAAVEAAHGRVDGLVNNAGIIQPFVPVAELDDATQALVDDLLTCAPVAVGLAKRVMDASARPALSTTLELEVAMQERCARSADYAEGANAFREKRPPQFTGS